MTTPEHYKEIVTSKSDNLKQNLDDLLEDISVDHPMAWSNETGPKGWYAVSSGNKGIFAYFADKADALRFRLDYINQLLNPVSK